MTSRLWQIAWATGTGVVVWICLAEWMWYQTHPLSQAPAYVLPMGFVAFALYVLDVGYVIYLRSAPEPNPPPSRMTPFARWMLTVAALCVFASTMAFGFPRVLATYAGMLFCQTVSFAIIAVGVVAMATGGFRRRLRAVGPPDVARPEVSPQEPFWRVVTGVVSFPVLIPLIGVIYFVPVVLAMKLFELRVDVPACRRFCQSQGLTYHSYASGSKGSPYTCFCNGPDGLHAFHERGHILGAGSWISDLGDTLVRGSTILFFIALPWLLFVAFGKIRRRLTKPG